MGADAVDHSATLLEMGIAPRAVGLGEAMGAIMDGEATPAQIGGHKPRALAGECANWLRARIGSGPFTLRGLTAEMAERGIKTHPRAVWVFLHAEGLSFTKNPAAPGADAS